LAFELLYPWAVEKGQPNQRDKENETKYRSGGVTNHDQALVRDTGKVKELRLGSQPQ
jgi:hypothetical protein